MNLEFPNIDTCDSSFLGVLHFLITLNKDTGSLLRKLGFVKQSDLLLSGVLSKGLHNNLHFVIVFQVVNIFPEQ